MPIFLALADQRTKPNYNVLLTKKKHIPQLVQPLSYQPKPYTIYSEPVVNFDNSENATPPPEVSFYNKCSYKPPQKKIQQDGATVLEKLSCATKTATTGHEEHGRRDRLSKMLPHKDRILRA
jgi:hypothetical protein